MQITRLRVSGFKSFSDPAELLIERGLTGIVGPNGCGKSNIVEALRWVMGESSARGLRGDGMEDVIFSGSAARAPFEMAEVRLRLRGRIEGLAGFGEQDEIEICRQLSRGAGSLYRINGREARARDIQLLFADAGSGARSSAMLGQGQINFVIEAKPQERRRLLEDAAGIGGLHGRRREAELRLESTEQNLARIMDLLRGQEKRLEDLARQNRQAERYRKLAAEIRATETLLLLARWAGAKKLLAGAEQALTECRDAGARSQSALEELRRLGREEGNLIERLRARSAELGALAASLEERSRAEAAERERRMAHLAELGRRRAEIEADHARELARRTDAAERGRELAMEREQLAVSGESLQAELARLDDELDAAATQLAAREQASQEVVASAAAAEAVRQAVTSQLEASRLRREELRRALSGLPEPEAESDRSAPAGTHGSAALLETTREALGALEAEIAGLRARREQAEQALAEAEPALAAAREECDGLERGWAQHQAGIALVAERERACAREEERLRSRESACEKRVEAHRRSRAALDAHGARAAARRRAAALAAAKLRWETLAEEAARSAAEAQAAEAAHGALAAELQGVEAERQMLLELLPLASATALIDRVAVEESYADALAAALGDDLLAGTEPLEPEFWRAMDRLEAVRSEGDPPLPEGAEPLLEQVQAPAILARRLAQIGVVEPATAVLLQARLRPGQRLVSRCGGLWRWDGLVRRPGTAGSAAAGLRQRQRCQRLLARAAELRARLEALATAASAATRTAAEARAAADATQEELASAQGEAAEAERRLERAQQAEEALERDGRELTLERAALARERADLDAERADVRAAMPDADATAERAAALEEARRRVAAIERQASDQRAARRTADLALAEAERRALALRAEEVRLRHGLEAAREREARAALAQATRAAEAAARREALRDELLKLEEAIERSTAELVRADAAALERAVFRRDADAALTVAREAHADVLRRRAAAREELARQGERAAKVAAEIAACQSRLAGSETRLAELATRARKLGVEAEAAAEAAAEGERGTDELAARLVRVQSDRDRVASELAEAEAAAARRTALGTSAEEAAARARERLVLADAERSRAQDQVLAARAAVAERIHQPPETLLQDATMGAEVERADMAELEARLARLRAARERLGPVNLRAETELGELMLAVEQARGEEAELRAAVERLKRAISTINRESRERLLAVFEQVDRHFRALFVRLFGGGRAHLRLTDGDDPLAAGLELEASPPGKRLTSIALLSGGEKTLTALALVFAFFLAQPAPLCVLDEVDAPLDDANVDRLVALMDEISAGTETRFLVVTHHPLTMARMHRLYGVTMLEQGVSRLVSVALEEAVEMRASA